MRGTDEPRYTRGIGKTLTEQNYRQQSREAKGLLRTYVLKMTGLSRAQVTRLIGQHSRQGQVREAVYRELSAREFSLSAWAGHWDEFEIAGIVARSG